ncbi:hypothetical protein [Geobacillus stearothermophilus]
MFVSTGKTDDPKDYKSVTGCSALAELLFFIQKNIYINQKISSDVVYKNRLRWNRKRGKGRKADGVS